MTGGAHDVPIAAWRRELFRAAVLAYREAKGRGELELDAYGAARDAYVAAGGDPERAPHER